MLINPIFRPRIILTTRASFLAVSRTAFAFKRNYSSSPKNTLVYGCPSWRFFSPHVVCLFLRYYGLEFFSTKWATFHIPGLFRLLGFVFLTAARLGDFWAVRNVRMPLNKRTRVTPIPSGVLLVFSVNSIILHVFSSLVLWTFRIQGLCR